MSEEEGKTLDELEAEYAAELKKKVQFLKDDNEAKEKADSDAKAALEADKLEAEKIEADSELVKKIAATYGLTEVGDAEVDVDPDGAENSKKPTNKLADFHSEYLKSKGINRVEYGSSAFVAGNMGYAYTDSDTGCEDDVSAWTKADVFADLIWQAAQCGRQLSGVITMRGVDINAGDGLVVQIKAINASSMGSALDPCECSACSSNVFTTYSLTLKRYDIYKVLCNLDIFSVGDSYKAAVVESMSRAFISGIDALIWTAISGAVAGFSEQLAVAADCDPAAPSNGCCNYGTELYKEIIELEAKMREAGYGPDFFLILNPRVATYLKYKEGGNYPPWVAEVQMEGNTIVKIGNIKVIEYCGATSCTADSEAVMAVMVDQKRAVGEAYGKRPSFKTDEDPIECDSQKLIERAYIAVDALDLNAIGHIINPTVE